MKYAGLEEEAITISSRLALYTGFAAKSFAPRLKKLGSSELKSQAGMNRSLFKMVSLLNSVPEGITDLIFSGNSLLLLKKSNSISLIMVKFANTKPMMKKIKRTKALISLFY